MLPGGSALQRLEIQAFDNPDRDGSSESFEVAFNPATVNIRYGTTLATNPGVQGSSGRARYVNSRPTQVSFSIFLDGSGANNSSPGATGASIPTSGRDGGGGMPTPVPGANGGDVSSEVDRFLELCWKQDTSKHEPRHLTIVWGTSGFPLQNFKCRLMSAEVTFGTFSAEGAPAYAQIEAVFVEDRAPEERSSPDLTHRRTVLAGDTLPAMCREIYGSSKYYIRVARYNKIDNIREITPGMQIHFPPLA